MILFSSRYLTPSPSCGVVFFALADVGDKLELWRQDYN
jgi:hypothetical protein